MRTSIRRTLTATVVSGFLATAFAFLGPTPAAAQDPPKNLKVLPKTMSRQEVRKLMKGIAGSLGVQCDHCHDTDDFPKDTEHKEVARAMMRMTGEINKSYFEGESKVSCMTCHNGQAKPKGTPKSAKK
jgi:putative NADH-flavin reductase